MMRKSSPPQAPPKACPVDIVSLKIAGRETVHRQPRVWPPEVGTILYTAYPFDEMDDPPGEHAPVRPVEFVSYDGDKYAKVKLPGGILAEVKSGYLFDTIEECFDFEYGSKP